MEPQFHKNYWWVRIGISVALALLFFAGPAMAHSGRTESSSQVGAFATTKASSFF